MTKTISSSHLPPTENRRNVTSKCCPLPIHATVWMCAMHSTISTVYTDEHWASHKVEHFYHSAVSLTTKQPETFAPNPKRNTFYRENLKINCNFCSRLNGLLCCHRGKCHDKSRTEFDNRASWTSNDRAASKYGIVKKFREREDRKSAYYYI